MNRDSGHADRIGGARLKFDPHDDHAEISRVQLVAITRAFMVRNVQSAQLMTA